jgi:hypothetical protein
MIGPKYVIRAERFSLKRRNHFIGCALRLSLAPNRLRSFAEISFACIGLSAELQQSAFASVHASERVEFHRGIPVLLKIPVGFLTFYPFHWTPLRIFMFHWADRISAAYRIRQDPFAHLSGPSGRRRAAWSLIKSDC